MNINDFLSHLKGVKRTKDGWSALCPAHNDKNPSLSITCGSDNKILIKCFAGCSAKEIVESIGLAMQDLFTNTKPDYNRNTYYYYQNEAGDNIYRIVKTPSKKYIAEHPHPNGNWVKGLGDACPVPYRLPQLLHAAEDTVFIVEGEKDCDSLAGLGLVATTNPFGAGKWQNTFSNYLVGRTCVILPDNDPIGEKHGQQVSASLRAKASCVKVIGLPGLPEKGDVTDWLNKGGTKEKLLKLVKLAPVHFQKSHPSIAEAILLLAKDAELFHNPANNKAYASALVGNYLETLPISSEKFRDWLRRKRQIVHT